MQTTRIVLAMLDALVTPLALSAHPKKLPPAPAPHTAPAGTALLAPGHRLDELGSARSASSDDEDGVEHHPVRDEGTFTHSGFDDEDRVDHHPVP
jgi:hypothetical protein